MKTSLPPGLRLVRTLRIAATGFEKNIIPKREKQRSNSGAKRWVWTSPSTKRTLSRPAARASARPFSRNARQQSRPSTEPCGPVMRASSIAVSPHPQPTSTMLEPRVTSSVRNGTRLCNESPSTRMLRKRSNFSTSTSFQNAVNSSLVAVSTSFMGASGMRVAKPTPVASGGKAAFALLRAATTGSRCRSRCRRAGTASRADPFPRTHRGNRAARPS